MTTNFDTTQFVLSHGHKPRGSGTWVFFMDRKMDVMDTDRSFWSPVYTTYSEAKKMARAWVRERFGDDANVTLYVGT